MMQIASRAMAVRRTVAVAAILSLTIMAFGGAVRAGGPSASVVGSYSYSPFGDVVRHVAVEAHDDGDVRGTWMFHAAPGRFFAGRVTCLNIQGDEAFMFGPGKMGGRGAFLWVRDGDAPGGAEDFAITWIQDLPGDDLPPDVEPQTLEEMEGWCRNGGGGFPALEDPGIVPVIAGNLTILD